MRAEKLLTSANYQNENKGRLKILYLLFQLNKKENNAEGNCLRGFKEHVNFISGLLHRLWKKKHKKNICAIHSIYNFLIYAKATFLETAIVSEL